MCKSPIAIYVGSFLLFFAVFIIQIWRFVGASIDPGLGIHDIGWQRAAGTTTAALHAITGVLIVFIWVIGKRTHWLLIWATSVMFITDLLVQTAITGADMCLLAHGSITYAQVGLDYAILSTEVLFISLILAYNMRWRPSASMLDNSEPKADYGYAAMPAGFNDMPLNGTDHEERLIGAQSGQASDDV